MLYGNGSKRKRGDCDRCSYTNEGRDDPLSMITLVNSQKEGRMRPTLFSRIPFFCTVIAAATLSSPEKKKTKKNEEKKGVSGFGKSLYLGTAAGLRDCSPFRVSDKEEDGGSSQPRPLFLFFFPRSPYFIPHSALLPGRTALSTPSALT